MKSYPTNRRLARGLLSSTSKPLVSWLKKPTRCFCWSTWATRGDDRAPDLDGDVVLGDGDLLGEWSRPDAAQRCACRIVWVATVIVIDRSIKLSVPRCNS